MVLAGCASGNEPGSSTKHVSPPPQARATVPDARGPSKTSEVGGEGVAQLVGPAWQSRALGHLTPELRDAFRLANVIGDRASQDYEAAITKLRGDTKQDRALRAFYAELPAEAFGMRHQVVHLAGLIGTADFVPMLEAIAMTPLSLPPPATPAEEHGEPTVMDQEAELRNGAVGALSRLAKRDDKAALASLLRLLAKGDKEMAILAGVELVSFGKLHAEERGVLAARGIKASFAKMNEMDREKSFKIDPADADANPNAQPAIVPPPAP